MKYKFHTAIQFFLIFTACTSGVFAVEDGLESCIREKVIIKMQENEDMTLKELRNLCLDEQAIPLSDNPTVNTDTQVPERAEVPTAKIDRPVRERKLIAYKKNYISLGTMWNTDGSEPFSGGTADIKFELGAKFQLFDLKNKYLDKLYFGYSQKSWWNVAEDSLPFAESNYNPELFFESGDTLSGNNFVYQLGIEHESNGRSGPFSRSWNRVYAQGEIELSDHVSLGLKLWEAVEISEENKDITDYLGNARLNAKFRYNDDFLLNVSAIKGQHVDKYSFQVDLIANVVKFFNANFFLTYYNGYGEALISYNRKTESIRAGFVLSYDDLQSFMR